MQDYIDGWTKQLPDYRLIEWNEENFDLSSSAYVQQAYERGKFAFVSDVARLHALFTYGGVYLDTDVEIVRRPDILMFDGVVLGFEQDNYVATSTMISPPASRLIADFLDNYNKRTFLSSDHQEDQTTNVRILTSMLEGVGLIRNGCEQAIYWKGEKVRILDRTKLSPLDYANAIDHSNLTTFMIHHFVHSWCDKRTRRRAMARKFIIYLIGGDNLKKIRKLLSSLKRATSKTGVKSE